MSKFFGSGSDCPLCRMMRSLAFSGIGAAIGAGIGSLFDLQKSDVWMSAVAGAFVMVFIVMRKIEKK
jgi:hypothetical protein